MKIEKEFRWCFIGSGNLANKVAKQIIKSKRHKIVSVYSRRIESSKLFCSRFGGTPFETAFEAINREEVDGVYIVTPHQSHYEYAELALSLGKPVLCEKPMTVSSTEAESLFELAREKNVYLVEAMWTWFSQIPYKIKEWIDEGKFGKIYAVSASFCTNLLGNKDSRILDPNRAGGAILDVGIYPITYVYRLFGMPKFIRCKAEVKGGIDYFDEIEMEYDNNFVCRIKSSISTLKGGQSLLIKGSKAGLSEFRFYFAKKAILRKGLLPLKIETSKANYLNEFDCVAEEIRSGLKESKLVKPEDTINVLRLIDECRKQINLVYPFEKK